MTKTMSATDAKNNLGAILKSIQHDGDPIVIESRKEPTAVVMSVETYKHYEELRQQERRRQAIEDLRELRKRVSERNKDMSEQEIEEFAEKLVQEAAKSMFKRGVVRYEE